MSEQFEHNIRKVLQEADVPFEPAAWERMEKLLDAPQRRRPIWWWLGGLVLLIGIGGWWIFSRPNVDKTNSAAKNDVISEKQIQQPAEKRDVVDNISSSGKKHPSSAINTPAADDGNPNVDNSTNSSASPSAGFISKGEKSKDEKVDVDKPASNFSKTGNQKSSAGKNAQISKRNPVSSATAPLNLKRQEPDVNNGANNSNNSSRKIAAAIPDVNKPANPSNIPDQKSTQNNPDVDNAAAPTIQPQNQLPPAARKTDVDKGAPVPASTAPATPTADTANATTESWKAPRRKGFEGGIHLGPDVNATGSFTGTKIGFTGGLLLRYHVNNRWFVSTGAAYTKKTYGATPAEYKSPYQGTYTDIDADCDVIDVPLNLHYVFSETPSGRWNVSLGASTYFMLREKYDYYYPNYYKRTRVFSNQNQHWFSVINLSAGWEKNTKGRLNWGLQPYVKIPAGGVGEGKVKLYSAGLSLQLTLGKK